MNSSEKNSDRPSCEFQDNLNLLRQTYFFSGLPLETLKVFAYLCTRESFDPGEQLFRQGEEDGQAFYFIGFSFDQNHLCTHVFIKMYVSGCHDFSMMMVLKVR